MNDPLSLRQREFFSGPVGRIESRSTSPAKRNATADAARLAEALDDLDEVTDDAVFQTGRALGFTPARTLAAIRSAMRTGLVEAWHE